MATDPCPRCSAERLSVLYYDAEGNLVGGSTMCTHCGPRDAVIIEPRSKPSAQPAPARRPLRKAS